MVGSMNSQVLCFICQTSSSNVILYDQEMKINILCIIIYGRYIYIYICIYIFNLL